MAVSCRIEHDEDSAPASRTESFDEGGKRTPPMMWTTPLLATLSALITFLRSLESKLGPTRTCPFHFVTCSGLPSTVLTAWNGSNCADRTCSGRTWYFRMSTSLALFSGFIKLSSVPGGRALNASSVGAKTVNFPAELKVSTKSPATKADTKILKSAVCSANCTMFGVAGGNRTPSMMWTTPLLAKLSAAITFLRSEGEPTRTLPSDLVTVTLFPSTVLTTWDDFNCVDSTCSGRTWYSKISASFALFSGFIRSSSVPDGRALNASFVGAKTVNFPAELKVSAKSAATKAETRVLKSAVCSASCTMFFSQDGAVSASVAAGGKRTPSMM